MSQEDTFTVAAKKLSSNGKPEMARVLQRGFSDPLVAHNNLHSLARAAGLRDTEVGLFLRDQHVDWKPL